MYRDKQYETNFNKFLKKNATNELIKKKKPAAKNKNKVIPTTKRSVDESNVTPLDEAYQKSDVINTTPDSSKPTNNSLSENELGFVDEIDQYWYDNYSSGNKGLFMDNDGQDQVINFNSLDDFFDKSVPQHINTFGMYPYTENSGNAPQEGNENVGTPDTEALKNQVIEKLATLIPDENNLLRSMNKTAPNNQSSNEGLQKFMFNNGSSNYSDEINF